MEVGELLFCGNKNLAAHLVNFENPPENLRPPTRKPRSTTRNPARFSLARCRDLIAEHPPDNSIEDIWRLTC